MDVENPPFVDHFPQNHGFSRSFCMFTMFYLGPISANRDLKPLEVVCRIPPSLSQCLTTQGFADHQTGQRPPSDRTKDHDRTLCIGIPTWCRENAGSLGHSPPRCCCFLFNKVNFYPKISKIIQRPHVHKVKSFYPLVI